MVYQIMFNNSHAIIDCNQKEFDKAFELRSVEVVCYKRATNKKGLENARWHWLDTKLQANIDTTYARAKVQFNTEKIIWR